MNRFLLVLATILAGLVGPAVADIYEYRDYQGQIHFTDKPMSGNYHLIKRHRFTPRPSSRGKSGTLAAMQRRKQALEPLIASAARANKLKPELVHAVVRAESAYKARAVSSKGAQGLMQLMPATAKRLGVRDAFDPRENLQGGSKYLSKLLQLFDNDLRLALAAYNAGENAVARYGNKIPPFPETQQYVRKVMRFYQDNLAANKLAQR